MTLQQIKDKYEFTFLAVKNHTPRLIVLAKLNISGWGAKADTIEFYGINRDTSSYDKYEYMFELENNLSNWTQSKETIPAPINDKFIRAFIRRLFEYESRQDSLIMDILEQ